MGFLGCAGFGVFLHSQFSSGSTVTQPAPEVIAQPTFTRKPLPEAELWIVTVPANSAFKVKVAQSATTESVMQFAKQHEALAAINAGFFDPVNQKTTSYITTSAERNSKGTAGNTVADPMQNERLTQNPTLQPYLKQIFNRSEFRRYQCGQKVEYAISRHSASVPEGCQLMDAVGGGPRLLPELTAIAEGFVDPQNNRDAIGSNQRNARSAIGIKPDGTILLVMAAQKPRGVSLLELADIMKQLGAKEALNLDGGSSSAMVYQDQVIYGKVENEQRPVKSVLLVK